MTNAEIIEFYNTYIFGKTAPQLAEEIFAITGQGEAHSIEGLVMTYNNANYGIDVRDHILKLMLLYWAFFSVVNGDTVDLQGATQRLTKLETDLSSLSDDHASLETSVENLAESLGQFTDEAVMIRKRLMPGDTILELSDPGLYTFDEEVALPSDAPPNETVGLVAVLPHDDSNRSILCIGNNFWWTAQKNGTWSGWIKAADAATVETVTEALIARIAAVEDVTEGLTKTEDGYFAFDNKISPQGILSQGDIAAMGDISVRGNHRFVALGGGGFYEQFWDGESWVIKKLITEDDAKGYTDTKAAEALASAKDYADDATANTGTAIAELLTDTNLLGSHGHHDDVGDGDPTSHGIEFTWTGTDLCTIDGRIDASPNNDAETIMWGDTGDGKPLWLQTGVRYKADLTLADSVSNDHTEYARIKFVFKKAGAADSVIKLSDGEYVAVPDYDSVVASLAVDKTLANTTTRHIYGVFAVGLLPTPDFAEATIREKTIATQEYADTKAAETLASAEDYTDTKAAETLPSAESYADTKDAETLASAEGYTDTKAAETLSAAKAAIVNAFGKKRQSIEVVPEEGHYWNNQGDIATKNEHEEFVAYAPLEVEEGEEYEISVYCANSTKQSPAVIVDEDMTILESYRDTTGAVNHFSISVPSGAKYLLLTTYSVKISDTAVYLSKLNDRELNAASSLMNDFHRPCYDLSGKRVAVIGDSISTKGTDANVVEIEVTQADISGHVELSGYITSLDVDNNIVIHGAGRVTRLSSSEDNYDDSDTIPFSGGYTPGSSDIGKKVYFVPANGDLGIKIGRAPSYYSSSTKTWWSYLEDTYGCEIIPVCWSGASITSHERNVATKKCSWAWHPSTIQKCGVRTPGTMDRLPPDVIIVYRGTNDFSHSPYTLLTDRYFEEYEGVFTDRKSTNGYGFLEGIALTIEKLREAYPAADICLCTLNHFNRFPSSSNNSNGINTVEDYNDAIRKAAGWLNCGLIDFAADGINAANALANGYYRQEASEIASGSYTHPNNVGQKIMGKKALHDLNPQKYADDEISSQMQSARDVYTSIFGENLNVTWERGSISGADGSDNPTDDGTSWIRTVGYIPLTDTLAIHCSLNNKKMLTRVLHYHYDEENDKYDLIKPVEGARYSPHMISVVEGATHFRVTVSTYDYGTGGGINSLTFDEYSKKVFISDARYSLFKQIIDGLEKGQSDIEATKNDYSSIYGKILPVVWERGNIRGDGIAPEVGNSTKWMRTTDYIPLKSDMIFSFPANVRRALDQVTYYYYDPENETYTKVTREQVNGSPHFIQARDDATHIKVSFTTFDWDITDGITEELFPEYSKLALITYVNSSFIDTTKQVIKATTTTDLIYQDTNLELTKDTPISVDIQQDTRNVLIDIDAYYTLAPGMVITPVNAELYDTYASSEYSAVLNDKSADGFDGNNLTPYYLTTGEELNGRLEVSQTAGGEAYGWIDYVHAKLPKLSPMYYTASKNGSVLVYGENYVVGRNCTVDGEDAVYTRSKNQKLRLPPAPETAGSLRLSFIVPTGATLVIKSIRAIYEAVPPAPSYSEIRIDAHGAFYQFNEHTMRTFEAEAGCGASSMITIPKRSADGVWFCYHDDSFPGGRLKNADGTAIDSSADYYGQTFNQIPFGALKDYRVMRFSGFPGERLCLLKDFFVFCAKRGIRSVLSFHPLYTTPYHTVEINGETRSVREYARDALEIKALAKQCGVLNQLGIKIDSSAATLWTVNPREVPLEVLYEIFGNEIDGYIVTQGQNRTQSVQTIISAFGALKSYSPELKTEATIEVYSNVATVADIKAITAAGYRASMVQPASSSYVAVDGAKRSVFHSNDYDYWISKGATRFTTNKMASMGLNW